MKQQFPHVGGFRSSCLGQKLAVKVPSTEFVRFSTLVLITGSPFPLLDVTLERSTFSTALHGGQPSNLRPRLPRSFAPDNKITVRSAGSTGAYPQIASCIACTISGVHLPRDERAQQIADCLPWYLHLLQHLGNTLYNFDRPDFELYNFDRPDLANIL